MYCHNRARSKCQEPFRTEQALSRQPHRALLKIGFLPAVPLTPCVLQGSLTSLYSCPRCAEWKDLLSRDLLRGIHMKLAEKSDGEILAIANPIMNNLMDASTAIDHDRHVADFTDRLKAIVMKEHLEKVCRQYQSEKGYFGAREAVAVFRRPHSVAIVWKQRFTKQAGEYVAEMVLVEEDSRFLVDHVMVF